MAVYPRRDRAAKLYLRVIRLNSIRMKKSNFAPPAPCETLDGLVRLIVDSHMRVMGRPLLPANTLNDANVMEALWAAPQAVVAHGPQADPIFFYGNRMALELFEMDFSVFTALPSRFSAEPLAREERAALLERVSRFGFIDDYAGIRISSTGKRFRISNATVWNLIDADGFYRGQAAAFSDWEPV